MPRRLLVTDVEFIAPEELLESRKPGEIARIEEALRRGSDDPAFNDVSRYERIRRRLEAGRPIDPVILMADPERGGHIYAAEGLHRAFTAKRMGFGRIPAIVIRVPGDEDE